MCVATKCLFFFFHCLLELLLDSIYLPVLFGLFDDLLDDDDDDEDNVCISKQIIFVLLFWGRQNFHHHHPFSPSHSFYPLLFPLHSIILSIDWLYYYWRNVLFNRQKKLSQQVVGRWWWWFSIFFAKQAFIKSLLGLFV